VTEQLAVQLRPPPPSPFMRRHHLSNPPLLNTDAHCHSLSVHCLCPFPQGLLSALAPMVPHMAEDAWLNLSSSSSSSSGSNGAAAAAGSSSGSSEGAASVFMEGWSHPDPQWSSLSQVGTEKGVRGGRGTGGDRGGQGGTRKGRGARGRGRGRGHDRVGGRKRKEG